MVDLGSTCLLERDPGVEAVLGGKQSRVGSCYKVVPDPAVDVTQVADARIGVIRIGTAATTLPQPETDPTRAVDDHVLLHQSSAGCPVQKWMPCSERPCAHQKPSIRFRRTCQPQA